MINAYILDIADINADNYLKYYNILPEWRREKADACVMEKQKFQSVGAGLIFVYGCKILGIPADAEIENSEHGKPYFTEYQNIRFNISHSGNIVAAVFSDTGYDNGIDVQKISIVNSKLAERFFSSEEADYIGCDSLRFSEIWSLKESFLKATGSGLTRELNSFCILPGRKMQVEDYYMRLEIYEDYVLSICTQNTLFSDKIRTLTLMEFENMLY